MWKKGELKLKPNRFSDLAVAVIKQWKLDGQPSRDLDAIKQWSEIIYQHHQVHKNRLTWMVE